LKNLYAKSFQIIFRGKKAKLDLAFFKIVPPQFLSANSFTESHYSKSAGEMVFLRAKHISRAECIAIFRA